MLNLGDVRPCAVKVRIGGLQRGLGALLAAGLGLLAGCHASPGNKPQTSGGWQRPDPVFGAVNDDAFRAGDETIFSPLDLPTPSAQRNAAGAPAEGYWQQRCDYAIDASIDTAAKTIRGKGRVTYTNNSPDELPFIWIHLEQNVYRPDSLGARALGDDSGLGGVADGFSGGITIESMSSDGQPLKFTVYDTMARVELARPVAPKGGQLAFDVSWSSPIPPNGSDRMGWEKVEQGTLYLIAQWYPAVAVYDDVHGWNTLPYMSVGEFYFNFGSFDVNLTVPRANLVSATGLLQNADQVLTQAQRDRLAAAATKKETTMIVSPEEVGTPAVRPAGDSPTMTWRFKADQVRSFAWATSEAFIWDAAGAQGLSKPVLAQSFYPKEAIKTWSKSTDYLRFSIEHYSNKWFEYPYPIASNINGPIPGMEYPMIIFCAARENDRDLFGVTTHEIGHNWFPMTVNTDERRHAWMDEGFNTFINEYAFQEYFNEPTGEGRGTRAWTRGQQQPMATRPDFIWRSRLGWLGYGKPAQMLILLREQVLGPARFDAAFREYIRRWAFKSPQPADFFRTMENAAGVDLAWFWRGFLYGSGTLDQAVGRVAQPGEHLDAQKKPGTDEPSFARIEVVNKGEIVFPVRMRLTLADGTAKDVALPVQIWATTSMWVAKVDTGGKRITRVEIDAANKLPDVDPSNNLWNAEPQSKGNKQSAAPGASDSN